MNIRRFGIVFFLIILLASGRLRSDQKAGSVIVDGPFDIEMVYIPAGDLELKETQLRHGMTVHLSPFYIGKTEITQKQWESVMGFNPGDPKGEDLPVGNVNWADIQNFLRKLSKKTKQFYRLPTAAEWEYACRAGSSTQYHCGDDPVTLAEYEWVKTNSDNRLHPVGRKKPNPWGLYDLHGNAAEYTGSIWNATQYNRLHPDWSLPERNNYIVKGGCYRMSNWAQYSSGWEHAMEEIDKIPYLGFRVVRMMAPKIKAEDE